MGIDWKNITQEDKEELFRLAEQEKKAKAEAVTQERNRYKQLSETTVDEAFIALEKISAYLSQEKRKIYDSFNTLVELKKEVYNTTRKNKSHTFTDKEGKRQITIGRRELMRWDGTEKEGIELIDTYLEEKVLDDEMKAVLTEVLRRDANGQLDAQRVMSLAKLKEQISDSRFQEGVEIVLSAYKPTETAIYVEVRERSGLTQKWKALPLSFATVEAAPEA